jgi:hypothetical protein
MVKNDSIQPKENSKNTDFRPIKSSICKEQGCVKRPSFNVKGEMRTLYCSEHKKEGMVDVLNKTCIHEGCTKNPTYNIKGEKKALYCSEHKLEGMIDVRHKTCIHPACIIRPNFNTEGEKKALYCSEHKLEGMIDILNKKCIFLCCKRRSNFNIEGQKKALYCSHHKLEGMINVISKTCIHEDCIVQPTYNIKGEKKALYCYEHKLEGMIDILNKKCIFQYCIKQPIYNIRGEKKALYCSEHKTENMVNVTQKTCKTYLCPTQVKDKYDGYCLFCYMHLFPDKPVSNNYKTKEYAVVEFVKNKFPDLSWIADKIINGGCSKRRPDLLLDLGYQIVIIEVDENQHIDYDCSCQNKRIMELSQDLGHRPIIFIRFNPDDYKKDGKNITSCWGQNKKGICVVKKTKNNEWSERLNVLEQHINYWINPSNMTNKTIEIIQLYYDS